MPGCLLLPKSPWNFSNPWVKQCDSICLKREGKRKKKKEPLELVIQKEFTWGGRSNFKHYRMENETKPEKGLYVSSLMKQ